MLAIVIEALLRIARRALKAPVLYGLAAIAFVAIFAFHVPFPLIIVAAGLFGLFATRLSPDWLGIPSASGEQSDRAVDLAAASQAAPTLKRGLLVIAVCGTLWIAPVVLLALLFGRNSVYPTLAGFFSEMAVVTFGGAYAVLAYVAQAAVNDLHWLNPGEMLDGLALAETTPGPLILVLTFVGFLAGFRDPGGVSSLAGGLIGASLTTWVTFVPCFLWVLLGAPYIERLRSNRALSGALTAITAAVVGVILNLTGVVRVACAVSRRGRIELWMAASGMAGCVVARLEGVAVVGLRHAGDVPLAPWHVADAGDLRRRRNWS